MADWRDSYTVAEVARIETEVGAAANNENFNAAAHIAAVWGSSSSSGSGAQSGAAGTLATNSGGGSNAYTSEGPSQSPAGGSAVGSPAGGSTQVTNKAVELLSADAKADLYAQVGDAMYGPGFNLSAHIEANTKNGVFQAPVYTPPDARTPGAQTTSSALGTKSGASVDWLSWLNMNEKVLGVANTQLKSETLLKLPAADSTEWRALMEETGGAAANPGFNYAAHVAAITSQKVLPSLTEAEVLTLIAETGKTNFQGFNFTEYSETKTKAVQLAERVIGKLTTLESTAGTVISEKDLEIAKKLLVGSDSAEVLDESSDASTKTVLAAGAGDDTLKANALDSVLIGGKGNDQLDGGLGIDHALFEEAINKISIRYSTPEKKWYASSAEEGVDQLVNIERINANDGSIALDLGGNAGQVAKVLGAVFGETSISNKEYVGIGLDLIDGGMSYEAIAALAVSAAGKSTSTEVCTLLWTNVIGSAPTEADIAPFKAMLDSGQLSVSALTTLAADTSFNAINIDLVGLGQTGLAYV